MSRLDREGVWENQSSIRGKQGRSNRSSQSLPGLPTKTGSTISRNSTLDLARALRPRTDAPDMLPSPED